MLLCGTGAQNVINFLAVLDIPLPPQGDLSLVLPVRPHDTSPLCSSSALWTSQKTSTLETLEHGFSPTTCESSSLSNTFRSPVGMPASSDRLSLSTAAQCRTRRETFGYFQSTSTVQMHQDTAPSVSSDVSKRSCASACQSGVGEERNTSPNKGTDDFKEQTDIVTLECRESDDSPECETKILPDLVEDLSVKTKCGECHSSTCS
ncbi:hypothetical protein BaRGS_00017747 [Batillaria attramentaria]|uniref:Uncharacterized protein n=1 Tax=Batillaria attramentaria TaxID=370345 RepID=A0ABD0KUV6_9CAEN